MVGFLATNECQQNSAIGSRKRKHLVPGERKFAAGRDLYCFLENNLKHGSRKPSLREQSRVRKEQDRIKQLTHRLLRKCMRRLSLVRPSLPAKPRRCLSKWPAVTVSMSQSSRG